MKKHHGRISEWRLVIFPGGTIANGRFLDHWRFGGKRGHTSPIVKHDEITGEIETENSRYTLLGKPEGEPVKFGDTPMGQLVQKLEEHGYRIQDLSMGDIMEKK